MGCGDTQGFDSSSPAACSMPCGRVLVDSLPRVPLHHCARGSSTACTCGHGLVGGRHHHQHWDMPTATLTFQCGRGESGWYSDMTSTHGVWRHAGVRFLLSGGLPHAVRACLGGLLSPSPAALLRPRLFAPPVHVVMGRSGAAATTSTGTCRLPFWLFSVAGVSRAGART